MFKNIKAIMDSVSAGVSTPYSTLNSSIGGIKKGEWLSIMGGFRSGKTFVMLNHVLSALESGKSMLLVSTNAPLNSSLSKAIQREGFDLNLLENLHILDDYDCVSADDIFNKAKRLGVDGIAIDSIELLVGRPTKPNSMSFSNREDFVYNNIRGLLKVSDFFMFSTIISSRSKISYDPAYYDDINIMRHTDVSQFVSGDGAYRNIECEGCYLPNFNFKINFNLDDCFDLSEIGG
ncbi:hypothetical protein N9043_00895 [bacterium]|nr:hypothetical protein [bacterium]